ncbi:MAG TPA: helix-turn-helix domain-containing protein [Edaphocola sp.]|nr:helix-turn-helix domain-containing protein [Edaphocola sp.]
MEQNPIFEKAVSFVNQTNQSIFLTGKAGTGKTTFLKYIKEHSHKRMAVLAPTGVAAINAGGSTIHSFFYLPFGTFVPTNKTIWGGEHSNIYNKNQLFAKAKLNQTKRTIIQNLDTLIIDEISMVRADTLDAIDTLLRMVRRKPELPFGGVQMIFIGDMFQLPPVVNDQEWESLKEFYESPYFFDALVLKEVEPVYIELKKIFRQSDQSFINILNRIRNNDVEAEDLQILNEKLDPYFIPDAHTGFITLSTHNYKADQINKNALDQLTSPPVIFNASIKGDFPSHAYPAEEQLVLKVGAQVMFIKNDKGEERRYFNGKLATITALDEEKQTITVQFLDNQQSLVLELEEWENLKYDYDKEKDEIKEIKQGTFSQYPIRLAWAITIHKSQGLTFENAIIDAGQAFAPGQVYVALSRLTSLEGLILKSKITANSIYTDPKIIEFSKGAISEEAMNNILLLSQQIFAEQSILTAFSFEIEYDQWLDFTKDLTRKNIPEKEIAGNFALETLEQLRLLEQTGQKFKIQIDQWLNSLNPDRFHNLNERIQAGANWFLNIIKTIIEGIQKHIAEFKTKQKTKKYIQELRGIQQSIEKKKIQLEQSAIVCMGLASKSNISIIIEEVNKMFAPNPIQEDSKFTVTKEEKIPSKDISLAYYKEGKSVDDIAKTRGMAKSTIQGHLCDAIETGQITAEEIIEKEKYEYLQKIILENKNLGLKELKEIAGDEYSYTELNASRAQLKYLKQIPS